MSSSKNKLFKKLLVYNSVILTLGSIPFGKQVIAVPVEFVCRINGSYGVSFGMELHPKGRKKYPHKLFKIKSEEEFDELQVMFDINTGKGSINGSDAQIISRRSDLPREKELIISNPVMLYSKAAEFDRRVEKLDEENFSLKNLMKSDKRYLILDKGEVSSGSSRFTLIDTFKKSVNDKKYKSSKITSAYIESNTLQKIYYGFCKKSEN